MMRKKEEKNLLIFIHYNGHRENRIVMQILLFENRYQICPIQMDGQKHTDQSPHFPFLKP